MRRTPSCHRRFGIGLSISEVRSVTGLKTYCQHFAKVNAIGAKKLANGSLDCVCQFAQVCKDHRPNHIIYDCLKEGKSTLHLLHWRVKLVKRMSKWWMPLVLRLVATFSCNKCGWLASPATIAVMMILMTVFCYVQCRDEMHEVNALRLDPWDEWGVLSLEVKSPFILCPTISWTWIIFCVVMLPFVIKILVSRSILL